MSSVGQSLDGDYEYEDPDTKTPQIKPRKKPDAPRTLVRWDRKSRQATRNLAFVLLII